MREVYIYIQLNCYLLHRWKIGALRKSQPLLFAPWFPKLFSRAASNKGRLADGLSTEKCFLAATGLTCTRLSLLFPGLDKDRLQQGRPSLICSSTYWTSPTSTTSQEQPHQQLMMQQSLHQTIAPV